MRKTRLVILPGVRSITQIGCLLLFLACPTIAFKGQEKRDLEPTCKIHELKSSWWLPFDTGEENNIAMIKNGPGFEQCMTKAYNDVMKVKMKRAVYEYSQLTKNDGKPNIFHQISFENVTNGKLKDISATNLNLDTFQINELSNFNERQHLSKQRSIMISQMWPITPIENKKSRLLSRVSGMIDSRMKLKFREFSFVDGQDYTKYYKAGLNKHRSASETRRNMEIRTIPVNMETLFADRRLTNDLKNMNRGIRTRMSEANLIRRQISGKNTEENIRMLEKRGIRLISKQESKVTVNKASEWARFHRVARRLKDPLDERKRFVDSERNIINTEKENTQSRRFRRDVNQERELDMIIFDNRKPFTFSPARRFSINNRLHSENQQNEQGENVIFEKQLSNRRHSIRSSENVFRSSEVNNRINIIRIERDVREQRYGTKNRRLDYERRGSDVNSERRIRHRTSMIKERDIEERKYSQDEERNEPRRDAHSLFSESVLGNFKGRKSENNVRTIQLRRYTESQEFTSQKRKATAILRERFGNGEKRNAYWGIQQEVTKDKRPVDKERVNRRLNSSSSKTAELYNYQRDNRDEKGSFPRGYAVFERRNSIVSRGFHRDRIDSFERKRYLVNNLPEYVLGQRQSSYEQNITPDTRRSESSIRRISDSRNKLFKLDRYKREVRLRIGTEKNTLSESNDKKKRSVNAVDRRENKFQTRRCEHPLVFRFQTDIGIQIHSYIHFEQSLRAIHLRQTYSIGSYNNIIDSNRNKHVSSKRMEFSNNRENMFYKRRSNISFERRTRISEELDETRATDKRSALLQLSSVRRQLSQISRQLQNIQKRSYLLGRFKIPDDHRGNRMVDNFRERSGSSAVEPILPVNKKKDAEPRRNNIRMYEISRVSRNSPYRREYMKKEKNPTERNYDIFSNRLISERENIDLFKVDKYAREAIRSSYIQNSERKNLSGLSRNIRMNNRRKTKYESNKRQQDIQGRRESSERENIEHEQRLIVVMPENRIRQYINRKVDPAARGRLAEIYSSMKWYERRSIHSSSQRFINQQEIRREKHFLDQERNLNSFVSRRNDLNIPSQSKIGTVPNQTARKREVAYEIEHLLTKRRGSLDSVERRINEFGFRRNKAYTVSRYFKPVNRIENGRIILSSSVFHNLNFMHSRRSPLRLQYELLHRSSSSKLNVLEKRSSSSRRNFNEFKTSTLRTIQRKVRKNNGYKFSYEQAQNIFRKGNFVDYYEHKFSRRDEKISDAVRIQTYKNIENRSGYVKPFGPKEIGILDGIKESIMRNKKIMELYNSVGEIYLKTNMAVIGKFAERYIKYLYLFICEHKMSARSITNGKPRYNTDWQGSTLEKDETRGV